MFITLYDEEQERSIVYEILLDIIREEDNKKFVVCNKSNVEDTLTYFEVETVNGETVYSDIESDDDYYFVDQQVQQNRKQEQSVS
ncbi:MULTISPECIES: hypothetical protein [Bacillus subtilis group]|uniref:hypothetical protein n=1 Tax=Bacillus subtilis group TaxID=653685 RepID=UPI0027A6FDA9|nr:MULTISPECIES: hypothetical protein [Bacillus subtilis group]MEC2191682.1 hypothetical protein [Bacillus spizizenii]MEC2297474.1 hypothetical protein [Bacillus subtilis]MEC2400521.1 hypothetical protein [Bacillus subtilis]MED4660881.1 hypothetical protein [Bacillus subtilis]MED4667695.1 hypothetical protein [Bacillus subtilis]